MCGRVRVRSHATHGQACVYKTIWKNGNKEYNEKYLRCFFTKWNLKSAISYKCGRVVLFLTQVYFSITKLILLFSYCSHVPCIIISKVYYYIVLSMFPFVFNWSQSKASAVNQMSPSLFWSPKIFFCSFQFFENGIFTTLFRPWSMLWNSTLKITALFQRCLMLLISTLK